MQEIVGMDGDRVNSICVSYQLESNATDNCKFEYLHVQNDKLDLE